MNKKLQTFVAPLLATVLFLSITSGTIAQNCTVNAGVDKTVCPGEPLILEGNIGGNFVPNTLLWTQVSGPNTATISNATSISPSVTGVIAGTYVFQIQSTCQIGGNATDQVTYTVKAGATGINPGGFAIGCYTAGTSIPLTGTAPPGHSLTWSFDNSTEPVSGSFNGTGLTTATGNNPTVALSAPPADWCSANPASSTATIRVTSTNSSSGCAVASTFNIFFTFNPGTVTANGSAPVLCGPATPVKLTGSCVGNGTGLWTVVTQPGGSPAVNFSPGNTTSNVTPQNLVAGSYTFRWTVSGAACTTGSADVNLVIGTGSSSVTDAVTDGGKTFCTGTLPSTFALKGNIPAAGETSLWTQLNGAPATISNPAAAITQATGLTEAGAPYIFKYTITSADGFCSKSANVVVGVTKPVSWLTGASSSCVFTNETSRTITLGSVPFMNAGAVPVAMIYESGPATNLQVSFNAFMYNPDGTYANVYHQSPTSNIVLGGTASYTYSAATLWPTFNQYSAQFVFGFSTQNNLPSCGNILPGIYKFSSVYTDPCGATVTKPFEIRVSSVAAFNAGSDQMLPCSNTTTTLAGNTVRCEVQPFWTTVKKPASAPDPITAGNKFNTNAPLNNLQVGSYIFKWSSNAVYEFCSINSDSVRVTVSLAPPVAPVVSAPATGCINAPVTVSGQLNDDASSGSWSVTTSPLGGAYTISPSVNSPVITFTPQTASTVYTLTWTVVNGCGNAAASTTVTSSSTLATMPDISNAPDCVAGVFGTLTATPAGGVWTSSNPNYTLLTPNSSSTTVSPGNVGEWWQTGPVTFYYTLTNACGTFKDSVSFSRENYPGIPDNAFCNVASYPTTQSITLTNLQQYGQYEIYDITGPGTASITPMDFIATSATQNLSITVSQSGQYVIGLRRKNGFCSEIISLLVKFSTTGGLALAGPDISLCGATNSAALNAQPNPLGTDNGLWTLHTIYNGAAPTIANSTQPNSNISFANGGGDVLLQWKVMGDNPVCGTGTVDYVRVKYTPLANAGVDDITCRGASVPQGTVSYGLNGNNPAPGFGLWVVVSKPLGSTPVFLDDAQPNTTITGLSDGVYVLRWVVSNIAESCITQDDVTLVVTNDCSVLALDLSALEATVNGKDIDVDWMVNNEEDHVTYVLERAFAANGPFGAINSQKQDAAKNKHYSYTDAGAADLYVKNVYYRLKQITVSGAVSYSNVKQVRLKKENRVDVFPTILKKGEPVNIGIENTDKGNYMVNIVAVTGQVISKTKITKTGITQLSTAGLASGAYILQLSDGNNAYAYKVIIQ